jgi:hypothetical protein
MSEGVPSIKRIIANTINEKAFGDPGALAAHIVDALTENGIWIVPEDTALGAQPFDELTPEMRPQDPAGNGKGWWFRTSEHGGDEPDNMPQAITARDAEGRWAVYVPLTRGGKIVIPRPAPDEDAAEDPIEANTDWQHLPSTGDDEIRTGIIDDPDTKPTADAFWEGARVVKRRPTE